VAFRIDSFDPSRTRLLPHHRRTKETDMTEMSIAEWGPSHHESFEPWAEDGDRPDDN
jgi:hypothetical protein